MAIPAASPYMPALKFNTLIPELYVADLQRSLNFYVDVLGFIVEYQRPEDHFAFLSFHGSQLMLEQDEPEESPWVVLPLDYPRGRGLNLSIDCPSAEALVGRLSAAGYKLRRPIAECWYRRGAELCGEKNFLVMDPDGFLLRFAEDIGVKSIEQGK